MSKIKVIAIKKLKAHEKVNKSNLNKVKESILKVGYINNPIIVDQNNFIILDGHHRTKALSDLGCKKIPVFFVDYKNKNIRVISRRKNYIVNKDNVIKVALSNKLYPHKTTKHYIPLRSKSIKFELAKLY